MSAGWTVTAEDADVEAIVADRRGFTANAVGMTLLLCLLAGGALATLIMTTDPSPRGEELLAGLILVLAASLGSSALLLFGRRGSSRLADTLRAYRRGGLFGLACCGVTILQLNAALTIANVAFLLLVLLIVEMIFLAQRQHPI